MTDRGERVLAGRIVAPGIAVGTALVEDETVSFPKYTISEGQVAAEQERYRRAVEGIRRGLRYSLEAIQQESESDVHKILQAAEMMLADEQFIVRVNQKIAEEKRNAEWVVAEASQEVVERFQNLSDPYLRDRAEDLRDLGRGLIDALAAERSGSTCSLTEVERPVLVSRTFFPSTAMHARRVGAVAFATESQATASHAAIILKGLGIPVLGGVAHLIETTEPGDEVVVDATEGRVVVRPEPATRARYERAGMERTAEYERMERVEVPPPAEVRTRDGMPVRLLGNIANPRDLPTVIQNRLEGIGLFRTEFLAIERGRIPGEEEQAAVYGEVLRGMAGRPVVIRTLDIGADKQVGFVRCSGENPALGVRGLRRHLLREPEELVLQLRAILRASVEGNARILFPMVTRLEDLRRARDSLERAKASLSEEGVPFAGGVPVGAMIEIPAAAISIREFLGEVDFVSVGTNDLLQYFTAADRDNPEVLTYQDATEPAFLWLLEFMAKSAREAGRIDDVSICGEIASDPSIVPVLVALGYRTLSITPALAEGVRGAVAAASASAGGRS